MTKISGVQVIKSYVKTLAAKPGVYRMLNEEGEVLYVGKAKNLKKRVSNYTQLNRLTVRIQRMVSLTHKMEFALTQTESEALLLEANLIKSIMPRFNVLLKDDKSYPYILLTKDDLPPKVMIHRGTKKKKGDYFGPFASPGAVYQTLEILTRVFRLRTCKDTIYNNRSRPCLQYHIKRCTAPCVHKISEEDYNMNVKMTRDFLMGRTKDIQSILASQMQQASSELHYEKAAVLRDQIQALTTVQKTHEIHLDSLKNADIVAGVQEHGMTAIQVFFFRNGCNYGNRSFFPNYGANQSLKEIMAAFVTQFYLNKEVPPQILLNTKIMEEDWVNQSLEDHAKHKVKFIYPKMGDRYRLIEMAERNAKEALAMKVSQKSSQKKILEGLAKELDLKKVPERIEIYDNSHIQGADAYGCMVVAGPEGFDKKSYRQFIIKNAKQENLKQGGDDYAMMEEVLSRRFKGAEKDNHPDLIILDGGKGQLSVSVNVMNSLGLENIPMVAIAKGVDRNAGRERFFMPGRDEFSIDFQSPVMYYLQRLRDEAHRFAIGTHRAKRERKIEKSVLDAIPGVGPKRKKALLQHFGSARHVSEATVRDLIKVDGISRDMAQTILDYLR